MIKNNPYSLLPIPLYMYLIKTYTNFLFTGRCLNFPRVIQIQTQSRCNARCEMCPYRITSKELKHGVMEWDLFKQISDELENEKKPPMLMFALHNEPLLKKDVFEYIRYIKSKNSECYCILPTNGQSINSFSLEEIIQSRVDQLNLNFGAFSRETYERIYTGLDYETVRANIGRLVSHNILKKKLQIMFVLNSENARESHQALAYWKQQGIRFKLIQINNRAGSLDNYEKMKQLSFSAEPPLKAWKNLTSYVRHSIGCELPFYQMNVLYNGDVIICSCDWKRATVIGSLKNNSIKSIWNSDRANEIRRLILKKRYSQIDSCVTCSVVGQM
jgi:radical SAM protein with 4Fe4S-binding SPASM domain